MSIKRHVDRKKILNGLDRLRTSLGTAEAIARAIGCSPSLVRAWRKTTAKSQPTLKALIKLGMLETKIFGGDRLGMCQNWLGIGGYDLSETEIQQLISQSDFPAQLLRTDVVLPQQRIPKSLLLAIGSSECTDLTIQQILRLLGLQNQFTRPIESDDIARLLRLIDAGE